MSRLRSTLAAAATVLRAPATRSFIAWRFYRSRLVPMCVLVALLSVLFAGALTLDERVLELAGNGSVGALGSLLASNLMAASLLMLCHAGYLCLMAWHLVYRFPVEQVRWVAAAYLPITFAYFAHAFHVYEEVTHQAGVFHAAWWSSGAFAIVYLALVVHGLTAHSAAEERRPTQHLRGRWLMSTDVVVFLVTALMFTRDIGLFEGVYGPMAEALGAQVPPGSAFAPLYAQSSPKDVIVILALVAYAIGKGGGGRKLAAEQDRRDREVLAIQHFVAEEQDLASTLTHLPARACWVDVGAGHGVQVRELIRTMYASDIRTALAAVTATPPQSPPTTRLPVKVIYLGKDAAALKRAQDTAATAFDPNPALNIPQEFEHGDMDTPRSQELLKGCRVVHMAHVSYRPSAVVAALNLLRHAEAGTVLLLRFTSNRSFYRTISVSASCSPLWPYVHHHTHWLLLEDLKRLGWRPLGEQYVGRICPIKPPEVLRKTVDWCDVAYGEFSGDVAERYLTGLAHDGVDAVENFDRLLVLGR